MSNFSVDNQCMNPSYTRRNLLNIVTSVLHISSCSGRPCGLLQCSKQAHHHPTCTTTANIRIHARKTKTKTLVPLKAAIKAMILWQRSCVLENIALFYAHRKCPSILKLNLNTIFMYFIKCKANISMFFTFFTLFLVFFATTPLAALPRKNFSYPYTDFSHKFFSKLKLLKSRNFLGKHLIPVDWTHYLLQIYANFIKF